MSVISDNKNRACMLTYYIIKVVITTVLVVAISEVAKRSSVVGAIMASVPLISVLAMIWLYIDTKDVTKISNLSISIFWLVIPSLALFLTLPFLLAQGLNFYLSMSVSIGVTIVCYWAMALVLEGLGMKL
ncbi:DUF3147 family protein [Oceanisphaera sp. KMM 10153]|uniref:DUF3147 family protein n=1 Tax=Oceanisphaera submarina TaxID=3390193 RepID=UPI003974CF46